MSIIRKYLFHRLTITGIAILFQVILILVILLKLTSHFIYIYAFFLILSILITLYIINKNDDPSFKIIWIILIFIFPLLGGILYIFIGHPFMSKKDIQRWQKISKEMKQYRQNSTSITNIDKIHQGQAYYLCNYAKSKIYNNTITKYFPLGDYAYPEMLKDLKSAKKFIFLEYFIIEEGVFWNDILKILKEKAKEGVEIRVMYDDIGCIALLPSNYHKKLASYGIKALPFNRFIPILSLFHNNRDHRKIMVIDGKIAYTGGINLADEYINKKTVHGHWKDTAIRLEGSAVEHFTTLFLELWGYATNDQTDISKFFPTIEKFDTPGYVIPFGDSPFDKEYNGKENYMNIINQATDYVYINTPYFIVDYDMVDALCCAVKRGVKVKITLPHIPDKWYVDLLAKSYYQTLISNGVEVYEYKPGFIHAKSFVSDDKVGVVGTINLDYRSLVHHFECAVWLYQTDTIIDLKKDYEETLKQCIKIDQNNMKKFSLPVRIFQSILKLFAPLMWD